MPTRRHLPLRVRVTRDGVLTIEIGIDVNAYAFLRSPTAWEMAVPSDEPQTVDPTTRFRITQPRGFAEEVVAAMLEEKEDGSSMLSDMIDAACRKAVEDGSLYFEEIGGDS